MNKVIAYPELAKLMAGEGITKLKLSKIINVCPASVTQKMSGRIPFKLNEIIAIISFFKEKYPGITIEKIFCTDVNNSLQ